ncbi:unnamed protein product [Hymenolepis diminuta]|uniref:Uncharacterized protein n=1 Tax=Hymenolepis diminuta TaxID=6216 RepID=A0A564YJE9_HYMDI|nr:unnamed protein product [Hymenolepis diminuta]
MKEIEFFVIFFIKRIVALLSWFLSVVCISFRPTPECWIHLESSLSSFEASGFTVGPMIVLGLRSFEIPRRRKATYIQIDHHWIRFGLEIKAVCPK